MEGIKEHGQPYEIANASRDDLPRLFVEMGYKVGAEIGVYKGEFSELLSQAELKLFAIDPWLIYKDYNNPRGQPRLDFLYEHTKRLLAPYPNATIIRNTSMEAVNDFADASLDFVYIDANPEFRYVAEDLTEWTKKVRPGGIVSGHDNINATNIIKAYAQAYNIPDWYLIARKDTKEKDWLFVKP